MVNFNVELFMVGILVFLLISRVMPIMPVIYLSILPYPWTGSQVSCLSVEVLWSCFTVLSLFSVTDHFPFFDRLLSNG